jgi:hypothetical protein
MAAIPITAVFGTQAKVLLVPLDRPAAERGQAIHQGVQSAFGLDHHDISECEHAQSSLSNSVILPSACCRALERLCGPDLSRTLFPA